MIKKLTAFTLTALAALACSVEGPSSEDVGALQQELNTCSVGGLDWKPFLARLAYDAAEDFGRWEFTTDLQISGDRLAISSAGYSLCAARGRTGCPAVTAGLSAQDGWNEVHNDKGQVILNPNSIRTQLVNGFLHQQNNERDRAWITDYSEAAPYQTFQSPTRTGLPHSVSLTNCAVTLYADPNYTGTAQCLRTGSYRMADLKVVGNDRVSAVRVRSDMKVQMYEHDAFAGASTTLTSSSPWLGSFNDQVSSLVVSATAPTCSAVDSYRVSVSGGDWTKIRAKLVTLGYTRGNDILDVRLDIANNAVDVDPFNVDFVPPSQIGGTTYGVDVKSDIAETWRSTEDPWPSIFPVGSACKKRPRGSLYWYSGVVRSSGSYRYCYAK